jgi:hypothetical protein
MCSGTSLQQDLIPARTSSNRSGAKAYIGPSTEDCDAQGSGPEIAYLRAAAVRARSGTSTMDRSCTPGFPRPRRSRMRSRLYLSTLAAASLLESTLTASAQGPANSADSTETIPGTSMPADPGPIVGSDVPGRSMPSEITSGSAMGARPGKPNQPATTNSVTPTPGAGPTKRACRKQSIVRKRDKTRWCETVATDALTAPPCARRKAPVTTPSVPHPALSVWEYARRTTISGRPTSGSPRTYVNFVAENAPTGGLTAPRPGCTQGHETIFRD